MSSVELPRQANRWEDSQASVLTALSIVGGWVYITHDDNIIVRDVDWIAPSNRGPLALYKNRGSYYDRARKVGAWLRARGHHNPLNFNVHSPFLVDAERYVEAARLVEHLPAGFRASVYGNVYGLKTRRVVDPKVSSPGATPPAGWPVWSLSDRSFDRGLVGKKVRQLLADPGPYDG